MAMVYYANFLVEDPECEDFRHVSGILRVPVPLCASTNEAEVRALLARGLNVGRDEIQLVDWSPLH